MVGWQYIRIGGSVGTGGVGPAVGQRWANGGTHGGTNGRANVVAAAGLMAGPTAGPSVQVGSAPASASQLSPFDPDYIIVQVSISTYYESAACNQGKQFIPLEPHAYDGAYREGKASHNSDDEIDLL